MDHFRQFKTRHSHEGLQQGKLSAHRDQLSANDESGKLVKTDALLN
jgi:hypothetical protein